MPRLVRLNPRYLELLCLVPKGLEVTGFHCINLDKLLILLRPPVSSIHARMEGPVIQSKGRTTSNAHAYQELVSAGSDVIRVSTTGCS